MQSLRNIWLCPVGRIYHILQQVDIFAAAPYGFFILCTVFYNLLLYSASYLLLLILLHVSALSYRVNAVTGIILTSFHKLAFYLPHKSGTQALRLHTPSAAIHPKAAAASLPTSRRFHPSIPAMLP